MNQQIFPIFFVNFHLKNIDSYTNGISKRADLNNERELSHIANNNTSKLESTKNNPMSPQRENRRLDSKFIEIHLSVLICRWYRQETKSRSVVKFWIRLIWLSLVGCFHHKLISVWIPLKLGSTDSCLIPQYETPIQFVSPTTSGIALWAFRFGENSTTQTTESEIEPETLCPALKRLTSRPLFQLNI